MVRVEPARFGRSMSRRRDARSGNGRIIHKEAKRKAGSVRTGISSSSPLGLLALHCGVSRNEMASSFLPRPKPGPSGLAL